MKKKRVSIIFEKEDFRDRGITAVAKCIKKRPERFLYIVGATQKQRREAKRTGVPFAIVELDSRGCLVCIVHLVSPRRVTSYVNGKAVIKEVKYYIKVWDASDLQTETLQKPVLLKALSEDWPKVELS